MWRSYGGGGPGASPLLPPPSHFGPQEFSNNLQKSAAQLPDNSSPPPILKFFSNDMTPFSPIGPKKLLEQKLQQDDTSTAPVDLEIDKSN